MMTCLIMVLETDIATIFCSLFKKMCNSNEKCVPLQHLQTNGVREVPTFI